MALHYEYRYRNTLGWRHDALSFKPLAIAGAVLAIGAFLSLMTLKSFFKTQDFLAHAVSTNATAIGNETVEHRDKDGKKSKTNIVTLEFKDQSGASHQVRWPGTTYMQGAQVPIIYNSANPGDARSAAKNVWTAIWTLAIFSSLFLLIGLYLFFKSYGVRQRANWLVAHGKRIQAMIMSIDERTFAQSQGAGVSLIYAYYYDSKYKRHIVHAQWKDPQSGRQYQFESPYLIGSPAPGLVGKTVTIIIDPANPANYYFSETAALQARTAVA